MPRLPSLFLLSLPSLSRKLAIYSDTRLTVLMLILTLLIAKFKFIDYHDLINLKLNFNLNLNLNHNLYLNLNLNLNFYFNFTNTSI